MLAMVTASELSIEKVLRALSLNPLTRVYAIEVEKWRKISSHTSVILLFGQHLEVWVCDRNGTEGALRFLL